MHMHVTTTLTFKLTCFLLINLSNKQPLFHCQFQST